MAEVLGADRFGNVALLAAGADLTAAGLGAGTPVSVGASGGAAHDAVVARAFADVRPGGLLVHVDSHGHVALAVRDGEAATRLGAGPGRAVRIAAGA